MLSKNWKYRACHGLPLDSDDVILCQIPHGYLFDPRREDWPVTALVTRITTERAHQQKAENEAFKKSPARKSVNISAITFRAVPFQRKKKHQFLLW